MVSNILSILDIFALCSALLTLPRRIFHHRGSFSLLRLSGSFLLLCLFRYLCVSLATVFSFAFAGIAFGALTFRVAASDCLSLLQSPKRQYLTIEMNRFSIRSALNPLKCQILHLSITRLRGETLEYTSIFRRAKSNSTTIPKKQQRVRDHGFDNYMEIEKKMRKVLKFKDLILAQPHQSIPMSRFESLAQRLGFEQFEASRLVLKFSHIFQVYEHPVQRILYLRLTRKALLQIEQENNALIAQIPEAVTRLRKLLMLSNMGRLRLEHVRIARSAFGLPDDFEYSVVLKYPQYFRLFDAEETRNKYIEIVERDPNLAVSAIEKVREKEYRQKGMDAENIRFSFLVHFPPGFKLGKFYKIAMWKWQRLPYWSPYEDISAYDMRSLEAQNRLEKRAVAMIHELLSLTVEKKITLERIAHFRMAMHLPSKLKDFLLQHQGIFYISTRGNHGKLHTVFLREAYRKGELTVPNDLYLARRYLGDLILLSPRKAPLDRELVSYRRPREEEVDVTRFRNQPFVDGSEGIKVERNLRGNGGREQDSDSVLDNDVEPDFIDEDNEHFEV